MGIAVQCSEADVIPNDVIQKITAIVFEVGNRLRELHKVRQILERTANQSAINGLVIPGFRCFSDCPGSCMLFGELDAHFPDDHWDQVAHQYMLKLQEELNHEPLGGMALFNGAAGVSMAGWALSRGGLRYRKFVEVMNECIIHSCEKNRPHVAQRVGGHVRMGDYDAISGIAGIGRYLLLFKNQPKMRKVLEESLEYLVALTTDIEVDGHSVPGWYISVEEQFLRADQEKYPHGNFNLGLAHGIPGVLSLLSLTLLEQIEVPGQKRAIRKIVNWLRQFQIRVPERTGGYWPSHISWEEQIAGCILTSTHERDGWCYGTPGVGRAIYLAGCALEDVSLKELAIQSFDAVFAQSEEEWQLPAPTFCHGLAGLLHLTQLMFLDTGISRFKAYRQRVLVSLLQKYQPEKEFGFCELEGRGNELYSLDRVGVIDGAAGCALALLAVIKPIRTNWDVMFLVN